jgi:hypothetical protein
MLFTHPSLASSDPRNTATLTSEIGSVRLPLRPRNDSSSGAERHRCSGIYGNDIDTSGGRIRIAAFAVESDMKSKDPIGSIPD